ncbi:hypothetical protein MicvaDRAFT_0013 [Microcoleus vaginatus FGP-2]|nr:hypothetical protein MicvaDRAFT_0013 [Microcoleus vaginatus FGP-2]
MARGDGYPEGPAATLNTAAVTPMRSRRRIEHLKQLAYDCNLTNEQAKHFGKLTATATWEKLLAAHGLEFEPRLNTVEIASHPESSHQIGLTDWVDWAQAFALALASVGFALLILGLFPRINPLNLLPVKITIQVGK